MPEVTAGRELERNNDRCAHRGPAHVLFALALVGVPVMLTVFAAYSPQSIWWLGLPLLNSEWVGSQLSVQIRGRGPKGEANP